QVLAQTLWPRRAFSLMFVVFGGIALALASLGLFAVTAYAVSQRTREIGVRMALGAPARQVWWLVLRRTLFQVGLGLAVGACGAFVVGRLLRTWLVQTSPTDLATFLAVAAILVAVSLAAAFVPARRATRIDPLAALRCE
ncbi:MAG: FtsX-like permease family protein, partial [Acidobacteria bacterium]|nr:FtsX-like permease family protein [Acidobacteriota bacterium]MCA1652564.1 FtsX-like permease family protein [Acidobacteriota bacterium]